jgi:hypothetical protein
MVVLETVTLLTGRGVGDPIATGRVDTASSTGIGVAVVASVVALLAGIHCAVPAHPLALVRIVASVETSDAQLRSCEISRRRSSVRDN